MISWRNIAAYAPLITTLLVNRFQTCRTLIRNLHKVVVAVGGDEEYYVDRKGDYQSGTCTAECTYSPEFGGRTEAYELRVNN